MAQPVQDKSSTQSGTDTAWEMLKTALSDTKTQARQVKIDAVTAMGTLSEFEQARKLLRGAAQDSDRYCVWARWQRWAPARRRRSFPI